eukprot:scaffold1919_cov69-Cylindrotheca_fusiformis.AAC.5
MKNVVTIPSLIIAAALMIGGVSGFASSSSSSLLRKSSVALHLVPGQGNQLVAAYNAASRDDDDDDDDDESYRNRRAAPAPVSVQMEPIPPPPPAAASAEQKERDGQQAAAAARSFASRLFSLPSALRGKEEEVVLYPLVGFKFFQHEDKYIALPTKSHVACRLPIQDTNEEIYGWFSPACSLNYFSKDISQAPSSSPAATATSTKKKVEEEQKQQ